MEESKNRQSIISLKPPPNPLQKWGHKKLALDHFLIFLFHISYWTFDIDYCLLDIFSTLLSMLPSLNLVSSRSPSLIICIDFTIFPFSMVSE